MKTLVGILIFFWAASALNYVAWQRSRKEVLELREALGIGTKALRRAAEDAQATTAKLVEMNEEVARMRAMMASDSSWESLYRSTSTNFHRAVDAAEKIREQRDEMIRLLIECRGVVEKAHNL